MRAHFSRDEPRVGPHFRRVHNGMHFHNVHYWGKSGYHSEFSPSRMNCSRLVPLKQTLGGLSVVWESPQGCPWSYIEKSLCLKPSYLLGFCHSATLPLDKVQRWRAPSSVLCEYTMDSRLKIKKGLFISFPNHLPATKPIETKETDRHAQPGSLSQFELKHKRTKLTTQIKDQQSIKLHT